MTIITKINKKQLFQSTALVGLLVWVGTARSVAEPQDIVVATVGEDIQITQQQLAPVLERYQKNARKPYVSKDDKLKLIQGMIQNRLILNQKNIQAYRQDAEIRKKLQGLEDQLVIQKFVEQTVAQRVVPGEADLKAYYQQNRQQFAFPARVEASHILLRTRPEAEAIAQKLQHKGRFEQLAAEYSIDLPLAIKEKGKMAVRPIAKGSAVDELDEVLFSLAEGEISSVVESQYGFHIIRVDKTIPAGVKPFEAVREDVYKAVSQQQYEKAYAEMVARLEQSANIQVFEDRLP